jgi:hypothetical protein
MAGLVASAATTVASAEDQPTSTGPVAAALLDDLVAANRIRTPNRSGSASQNT